MQNEITYISFYLRANRVHIFIDALRSIGEPSNICFMISEDGKTLLMAPYPKKDLKSHRVRSDVYHGYKSMEICSIALCRILINMFGWDPNYSYRVPGIIHEVQKIVVFNLCHAERIEREH